jgi:hypothetical protein
VNKRALLGLLALGALAAGCGSAAHAKPETRAPSAAAPTSSPSPAATGLGLASDVDPLTGERPRPTSPVVVVKVDNAGTARKYQRGLGRAAIVYQELVESGETRFAAVFSQPSTGEVGPVRSVRETDIELLRQYGKVPVAFSGANTGVKATFHKAVSSGYLLDASYDVVPQDYRIGERRIDAYNFFTSVSALAKSRPGAVAQDIGLRFGPLAAGSGTAVGAAKAVYSTYVTVRVQYVPETGHYALFQNKHEMAGVGPANVVIQRVPVRMSKYVDVLGNPTPYTVTTGSGPATVLRDGRAMTGTWQRPDVAAGTRLLDASGQDIPLRPGPTWVLLLPTTSSLTLG